MGKEIAVCLDSQGMSAPLTGQGVVVVYRQQKGVWEEQRRREFSLERAANLAALRRIMQDIVAFLGDCRIFVGLSVSGLPYFELEKQGFSIWEYSGRPAEFLSTIAGEAAVPPAVAERKLSVVLQPAEIGPGYFSLSLIEVQAGNAQVTSKQVLQPFLRKGEFQQLTLLCRHLPPWLEAEFAAGNWHGEVSRLDANQVQVVIRNPVGKGG